MFSSRGVGQYAAGEGHVFMASRLYKPNGTKRPVVYCHGRGQSHLEGLDPTYGPPAQAIAEMGYPVIAIDAGGTTAWGNDTALARINDALTFVRSQFGASSQAPLVMGTSMGGLTAFNYALQYPTSGVLSIIGAINLSYTHDTQPIGLQATEVEAAYGGLAGYQAALPTHSPIQFGKTLRTKVAIYYSDDDPVTPAADARKLASDTGASVWSIGAVGHNVTGLNPKHVALIAKSLL